MVNYLGQVVRFDGLRFVVLGREDAGFAPLYSRGDEARVLLAGRDGALWVGTLQGAVWRVQAGRPSLALPATGRTSDEIRSLLETRDGSVWLGTPSGLRRLRANLGRLAEIDPIRLLPDYEIRALAQDEEGGVWIGTGGQGLYRRHDDKVERFTKADGLASDAVWSILPCGGGDVWVGTEEGLCRRRGGRFTSYNAMEGLGGSRGRWRSAETWPATSGSLLQRASSG